jgi:capsid protein
MDASNYYEVAFRGTRHSTIDPSKDMKAYIEGINYGLFTRTQICAELGTDFVENIKQLAMEEAEIERYGVNITPGDPKAVDTANAVAAGLIQTANDAEELDAAQAQDAAEEQAD